VYDKYHEHGLEILAFPSNQFGNQEPGTCDEIKRFARDHYHTAFPLFQKVRAREQQLETPGQLQWQGELLQPSNRHPLAHLATYFCFLLETKMKPLCTSPTTTTTTTNTPPPGGREWRKCAPGLQVPEAGAACDRGRRRRPRGRARSGVELPEGALRRCWWWCWWLPWSADERCCRGLQIERGAVGLLAQPRPTHR